MPQLPPSPFDPSVPPALVRGASERGQTLVELVVVMVIVVVLGAILVGVGHSSSDATDSQAAVSVARAYADAIEAFTDEHGGRAPVPGSSDWPAHVDASQASRTPADLQAYGAGPVNVAASGRPYIAKVPEPVVTGGVLLSAAGRGMADDTRSDRTTRIAYRSQDGSRWRLDVQLRQRATGSRPVTWRTVCSLGPDAIGSGVQRC
ncbi:MAG: hypothetical protein JWM98_2223 [Thermoleophilia bacterium]|nr:hypothetical protein [Thermoleophilia bacterium]